MICRANKSKSRDLGNNFNKLDQMLKEHLKIIHKKISYID